MKSLITHIFCFSMLILLSACCTKEGCPSIQPSLEVYLNFSGFGYLPNGEHELEGAKLFTYNKQTNALLDSIDIGSSYSDDFNIFESMRYPDDLSEVLLLKNKYYVVHTQVSNDTLDQISFDINTGKIRCHTCFFANGKETVHGIQNFEINHKGALYHLEDTIQIVK